MNPSGFHGDLTTISTSTTVAVVDIPINQTNSNHRHHTNTKLLSRFGRNTKNDNKRNNNVNKERKVGAKSFGVCNIPNQRSLNYNTNTRIIV